MKLWRHARSLATIVGIDSLFKGEGAIKYTQTVKIIKICEGLKLIKLEGLKLIKLVFVSDKLGIQKPKCNYGK